MQTGQGYQPDDFTTPAFCRVCGTHVPKTFLASSGGLCANCLRNVQQMQMGGGPAAAFPGQFPAPRKSFFKSTGCMATLVGLFALGLLFYGFVRFLGLATLGSSGGHKIAGVTTEIAQSGGSLVAESVDDIVAGDLRTMAVKELDAAFGQDAINPLDVNTEAVRDKRTDVTTYYAGGEFNCVIRNDPEHVKWKLGYQRDSEGKWQLISREAYYDADDGAAQFDWDVKKFIHLVH